MHDGERAKRTPRREEVVEIAHDLLQPMATVAALVEVALFEPDLSDRLRKCLEDIRHEARYATDACELLLAGHTDRERVRLDQVSLAAQQSAAAVRQSDISLAAEPVWVLADPVGLRRALANVIDNACRAAGPDGRVEIRVSEDDCPWVEVHDSGPGFGAGPSGRASLGLGIVQRVIGAHDGEVTVATSPLGGACVRLTFQPPSDGDMELPAPRRPDVEDEACG
jgi:signal transduction histidine kinase